jgi:proteasome assembly chaperone (PAC2) family protein
MIDYFIKKFRATRFAEIDPDNFYRFDDLRPTVKVNDGLLNAVIPVEARFFAASKDEAGMDLILFKAHEPHCRWFSFGEAVLSLCQELGVELIISLGGLQDSVVHTDAVISGFASSPELLERLKENQVTPAEYEGPGAIHSLIFQQAEGKGIEGVSLWGHCPFYLQGTHLLLLCQMATILADLAGFEVDTSELEKGWTQLARSIQRFIEGNPELQNAIREIMKSKTKSGVELPDLEGTDDKVIYLDDFFKPKA